MIRARFNVDVDDYRPINWPIKHPYWCTGQSDDVYIIVAYADDEQEILNNWPEAENIDAEKAEQYSFTDRFPKPEWLMKEQKQ